MKHERVAPHIEDCPSTVEKGACLNSLKSIEYGSLLVLYRVNVEEYGNYYIVIVTSGQVSIK